MSDHQHVWLFGEGSPIFGPYDYAAGQIEEVDLDVYCLCGETLSLSDASQSGEVTTLSEGRSPVSLAEGPA